MSLRKILVSLLVLSFFSDSAFAKKIKNKAEIVEVKLIDLIKDPAKFDGKEIITKGCFVNEFEKVILSVDAKNCVSFPPNGLWVDIPKSSDIHSKYFGEKKYKVTISGIVNSKNKGHMGAWAGALEKVNVLSFEEVLSKSNGS